MQPDASPLRSQDPRETHRASLDALRRQHPAPPEPGLMGRVRQVVVVASSSRGGSSVFAEMLRGVPGLTHLPAEINPFLRLHDLVYPFTASGSDALAAGDVAEAADALRADLAWECGRPTRRVDADRFAVDLACRLTLQWPDLSFPLHDVRGWMLDTLAELQATEGWPADHVSDRHVFHAAFLRRVRERHGEVSPWWYDLPAEVVRRFHPSLPEPAGWGARPLLEEPPFVTVGPWRPVTARELEERPLVIKTPSNAYRLGALRALFPQASLRVIHLVRNPGAAVNGLWDGWRHRGFLSHRLEGRLRIAGYPDPDWWKFDLPPGWESWTERSLPEVCGYQWRAAHEAILDSGLDDTLRVRFEDLTGPWERRHAAWKAIESWLGTPLMDALDDTIRHGLPPIMATARPRSRRWHERADLLRPVLGDARIRQVAATLGYGLDHEDWD